jgi:hypothetical protein
VREALPSTASLATHVGSFLPYSASVLDPWTGFYATRPRLKKLIRETEAALRTAEVLQASAFFKGLTSRALESQLSDARVLAPLLHLLVLFLYVHSVLRFLIPAMHSARSASCSTTTR